MAPEQVEGKPADARTDLWALGLILYEMLTGGRAFEASTPTSLVGAILEREPAPLKERQPLTPPSLERLVRRCLAKDPDDRWDTAHDVADELRWVAETAATPAPLGLQSCIAQLRQQLQQAGIEPAVGEESVRESVDRILERPPGSGSCAPSELSR